MNGFEGLTEDEFADIHSALEEGFAYVALPVTFYTAAGNATVDPLYGEGKGEAPPVYAKLYASYNPRPSDETLTAFGLFLGVNALLVIPRQEIILWEAGTHERDPHDGPRVFDLREKEHWFEVEGEIFNVVQKKSDRLPVYGETRGSDYIQLMVTGKIKPGPSK